MSLKSLVEKYDAAKKAEAQALREALRNCYAIAVSWQEAEIGEDDDAGELSVQIIRTHMRAMRSAAPGSRDALRAKLTEAVRAGRNAEGETDETLVARLLGEDA